MDINSATELCSLFDLGKLLTKATPVSGGLLHAMWHIKTDCGEYAIKELNLNIILKKNAIFEYELSEKIAAKFYDFGISTIKSITHDGKSVIKINDLFFIVYPWVDGKVLSHDFIDSDKAKKISAVLARMHSLKLDLKNFYDNESVYVLANIYSQEYAKNLYVSALNHGVNVTIDIADLCDWYQEYSKVSLLLKDDMVISHGDLDQKNVLWKSDGSPVIIDWESARLINPTQEIIGLALDWSGFQLCTIDFKLFSAILDSYCASGGITKKEMIEPSLWAFVGNWLNWLNFNIKRIVENYPKKEQVLAQKEIKQTFKMLNYLITQMEHLQNLVLAVIENR